MSRLPNPTDEDLEMGPIKDKLIARRTGWAPFRRVTALTTATTTRSLNPCEGQLFANLPSLTVEEARSKESLISLIVGEQDVKGSLDTACNWYARYLQCKFNSHWHVLAPTLVGLESNSTGPRPGDLVKVYQFVRLVAKLLKGREHLCLVDIVDEMDNEYLLKAQPDEERAVPNQLAFAAVGWLTMFFEAVSHPRPDKLEVTKTSTSSSGKQNTLVTRKYCTFRQSFDYIDRPLYSLLGRFGDLIPGARMHNIQHDSTKDVINVSDVCFSTLQQYADLNIEWVNSLALHLELDSGKKTLKVFQYPSYCRMMIVEKQNNLLSRLLDDHAARNSEDATPPDIPTDEFFEEIIRSYRLLFGQDDRSWKAFARLIPTLEGSSQADETTWACDPLLFTLCGTSSSCEESRGLYDDLGILPQANCYNPASEFPFFGKRLMALQQLVKQNPPQNIMGLINDRRDKAAWFAFISNQLLVFFATFTILLMVLSLIFQIWQVMLAKEQLQQGSQQNLTPGI